MDEFLEWLSTWDGTSWIGAGTVAVAAVTTYVTFHNGRRSSKQWLRERRLDAYSAFLDAHERFTWSMLLYRRSPGFNFEATSEDDAAQISADFLAMKDLHSKVEAVASPAVRGLSREYVSATSEVMQHLQSPGELFDAARDQLGLLMNQIEERMHRDLGVLALFDKTQKNLARKKWRRASKRLTRKRARGHAALMDMGSQVTTDSPQETA